MKYTLTKYTKNPSRGHETDAGIDIYVPYFTELFRTHFLELNNDGNGDSYISGGKILINPHGRCKLPTGVHFNVHKGNMLMVLQKTSVPNKTGIISGARVIDEDYHGQFIASLINTNSHVSQLSQGQKFIQLVLVPIHQDRTLEQLESLEKLYENQNSTRGTGAYGSTGEV